ncbi:MAG: DNRLRE domain-containing protein, partial [Anaerolineaceae bacterium]
TDTPSPTPTATDTATPTSPPVPIVPPCIDPATVTGRLPSADTYIDGGNPATNYGAANRFFVRPDNNADERGLLRFDLSDIPNGATVTSATLYLYGSNTANNQVISIYSVTTAWTETGATWQSWTTPGGDFDNRTAYAAFIPTQVNCSAAIDLTGLVQEWVDGSLPNHGMLLFATGSNHAFSFSTKEDSTSLERAPHLEVVVTGNE